VKVIIDTSAFVALASPSDQWHAQAVARREEIRRVRAQLYTTNAVLYETFTWLAVRHSPADARSFGRGVLERSPHLRILALGPEDELDSLDLLAKHAGIPLSFVDASLIHLARRLRLDRVFTFDRHFAHAGLTPL
jgi:predicted nucleic acid-binding protein